MLSAHTSNVEEIYNQIIEYEEKEYCEILNYLNNHSDIDLEKIGGNVLNLSIEEKNILKEKLEKRVENIKLSFENRKKRFLEYKKKADSLKKRIENLEENL